MVPVIFRPTFISFSSCSVMIFQFVISMSHFFKVLLHLLISIIAVTVWACIQSGADVQVVFHLFVTSFMFWSQFLSYLTTFDITVLYEEISIDRGYDRKNKKRKVPSQHLQSKVHHVFFVFLLHSSLPVRQRNLSVFSQTGVLKQSVFIQNIGNLVKLSSVS